MHVAAFTTSRKVASVKVSFSACGASLTDIEELVDSPLQVLSLNKSVLQSISRRTKGSTGYQRSWRQWSEGSLVAIRSHLSQNLPATVDSEGFSDLWFNLGVDKGEMPSFACAESRSGYALEFFCRAQLLANVLLDLEDNPSLPSNWQADPTFTSPLQKEGSEVCKMLSIGGGPGYDFVAAALVASFHSAFASADVVVEATIFDYEEGWHDLVESMATAATEVLPADHSCHWGGPCDLTKSLEDPVNAVVRRQAADTNLFVCQYCVAENANRLRESQFAFFREILQIAPQGATFVFTETTQRLWPDLADMALSMEGLEVGFLRNVRIGKSGPQLMIRKVETKRSVKTCCLPPDQQVLYNDFCEKRQYHERKMNANWERQKRKVRGSK